MGDRRYKETSTSLSYKMVGKKILPEVDMARDGDECTVYTFIKETNPERVKEMIQLSKIGKGDGRCQRVCELVLAYHKRQKSNT